jgi:hypothetical protein
MSNELKSIEWDGLNRRYDGFDTTLHGQDSTLALEYELTEIRERELRVLEYFQTNKDAMKRYCTIHPDCNFDCLNCPRV